VRRVLLDGRAIRGLEVEDRLTGETHEIQAARVCNCTGSLARSFAAQHDRELADLFVPSLAFNVLFDCERLGDEALAVAAPDPGAPVYFLCPAPFGVWAGTEHVGRPDGCVDPAVTEAELLAFIGRINRAIPSISLSLRNIRRVFSGLLPVRTPGQTDLTAREMFVDHGRHGGPTNLFSVTGIKFTTARGVAEKAVDQMLGSSRMNDGKWSDTPKVSAATRWLLDGAGITAMPSEEAVRLIREVAAEESVICAEDFCLRRTNWIFTARDFKRLEQLAELAVGPRPRSSATAGAATSIN
jgi:glycerol-3-phosphate dehydrogenase